MLLAVCSRTWNASSESPYGDEPTWRSRIPSIGSVRTSPEASCEVRIRSRLLPQGIQSAVFKRWSACSRQTRKGNL